MTDKIRVSDGDREAAEALHEYHAEMFRTDMNPGTYDPCPVCKMLARFSAQRRQEQHKATAIECRNRVKRLTAELDEVLEFERQAQQKASIYMARIDRLVPALDIAAARLDAAAHGNLTEAEAAEASVAARAALEPTDG